MLSNKPFLCHIGHAPPRDGFSVVFKPYMLPCTVGYIIDYLRQVLESYLLQQSSSMTKPKPKSLLLIVSTSDSETINCVKDEFKTQGFLQLEQNWVKKGVIAMIEFNVDMQAC